MTSQQCQYPSCTRAVSSASPDYPYCYQHKNGNARPSQNSNIRPTNIAATPLSVNLKRMAAPGWNQALMESLVKGLKTSDGRGFRAEQKEMVRSVNKHWHDDQLPSGIPKNRCQVRGATGIGKSLAIEGILKVDSEANPRPDNEGKRYAIVVPSINLAQQFVTNMQRNGVLPEGATYVNIHSGSDPDEFFDDQPISRTRRSAKTEQDEMERVRSEVQEWDPKSGKPLVAIVVYSVPSVEKASKIQDEIEDGIGDFDVLVIDEAHRTAGDQKNRGKIHNDEPDGIRAKNRVYLTATPKVPDVAITAGSAKKTSAAKKGTGPIYQNEVDKFGPFVSSYGLQYAVNQNLLVEPELHLYDAVTTGKTVPKLNDQVSFNGSPDLGNRSGLSYATYRAISTTIDSLVDGDQTRHSNALAFLDEIRQVDEFGPNFTNVAKSRSAAILTKEGLTQPQDWKSWSKNILDNPTDHPPVEVTAAKYWMVGEHSRVAGAHSKTSSVQVKRVKKFFDQSDPNVAPVRALDSDKPDTCSCQKPNGRCYCNRVVANVRLFSEGIDIQSIDTVVLANTQNTSSMFLVQAIGRASRKFLSKTRARVVIPVDVAANEGTETVSASSSKKMVQTINDEYEEKHGSIYGQDTKPKNTGQIKMFVHSPQGQVAVNSHNDAPFAIRSQALVLPENTINNIVRDVKAAKKFINDTLNSPSQYVVNKLSPSDYQFVKDVAKTPVKSIRVQELQKAVQVLVIPGLTGKPIIPIDTGVFQIYKGEWLKGLKVTEDQANQAISR